MKIIVKIAIALLLAALIASAALGCAGKREEPMNTQTPSDSPRGTEGFLPTEDTASVKPTEKTEDRLDGFMEGAVVKPEDVPELMKLLSEDEEYKDLSVQSITFKMYEGRQAYYVVLQGEGDASRTLYVFGDDTIIAED